MISLLLGSFLTALEDAKSGWVSDYLLYCILAGGVIYQVILFLITKNFVEFSMALSLFFFFFFGLYLLAKFGNLGMGDVFLISSISLYKPLIKISHFLIPTSFAVYLGASFLNLFFYSIYYMKIIDKKWLLLFIIPTIIMIYNFIFALFVACLICLLFSILNVDKIKKLGVCKKKKSQLKIEDYIVDENGEIKLIINSKKDIEKLPEEVYVLEIAPRFLPFAFIVLLLVIFL